MKLVVSGSRTINNYSFVKDAIIQIVKKFDISTIIHGAARGVDTLADKAARELGLGVEKYPANWSKYGRSAGMIRNREMAERADILLAIWDGFSPGTAGMIEIMRSLHKPFELKMYMSFNIWEYLGKADAICVTTNGYVTRKGKAVMGRGIARQATILFEGIEYKLGGLIRKNGNCVQVVLEHNGTKILSFPVKPEKIRYDRNKVVKHAQNKYKEEDIVPGFHAKANLGIIKRSCLELKEMIENNEWNKVYLPIPGSGAGELQKEDVIKLIQNTGLGNLITLVDSHGIVYPFYECKESLPGQNRQPLVDFK